MGYDIGIGNAVIQYDPEYLYLSLTVARAEHREAPAHCAYTKCSNYRSPSYTGWSEFCLETGIYEMFFGPCSAGFHRETAILTPHPGIQAIGQADLDYITAARLRREQSNGGQTADTDYNLARLAWLEYWIGWAVKSCQYPAICNS